jgi:cephalosporin-C deacetylase-like acetyl esterase
VPKAEGQASETNEPDIVLKQVYYTGEPYLGRPTRVFAYYARPAQFEGTLPAMVLVHGGGGTAFPEWATLWAKRGYAALAMDTAGQGPDRKRLDDGGPNQSHTEKFAHIADHSLNDMWTYHAVAAVIRGHSLLASLPDLPADRPLVFFLTATDERGATVSTEHRVLSGD